MITDDLAVAALPGVAAPLRHGYPWYTLVSGHDMPGARHEPLQH